MTIWQAASKGDTAALYGMDGKIVTVDFDGTICEDKWPDIGKERTEIIRAVQLAHSYGGRIILWTCRGDELRDQAVIWCARHEVPIDAVNENPWSTYGDNTRKLYADEYWDDKAVRPLTK